MKLTVYVVLLVLVVYSMTALAQVGPNPYGIAGWGRLSTLGMPADCIDYDWNNLHPGTLSQMCRPNHYYNYIGIPVRYWGYNEATGQINDPDQFATWIAANPGRVWIIANEPDLESQDGLTREQFAHMYKTYYEFISVRDPTAKFCIGAITGGSTTAALNSTKAWYEYVLDYHKLTYGYPMHIDIWNIHSYCGPTQIETPDQPINDFVVPFISWCHSVDGGRYAGCEVWITELPIGEWMGALSEEWIIWFAQRYLPRLERSGISRWFWFVSSDSGEWATVALVKSGVVSPLGYAYSALANGYPNDIVPVSPYVPDPTPQYFADDFSAALIDHPWMVKAGKWSLENGMMRQSRVGYPWWGETAPLQFVYGDFDMTLRMRVNNTADTANWAGVTFHTQSRFHSMNNSGYLVFMRRNGAVGLYNQNDGTIQEVSQAVADASQFQTIRVRMEAWRVRVWVNGNAIIDWTDSNQRFPAGYTTLHVARSDCSFDDLRISALPNAPTVAVDAFATSTSTLQADWSQPLPPWGTSEHQYAVGSTPGGTDVRGWTSVPGPAVNASGLSLSVGSTYYVSTRFQDTDGVWSSVGTSNGITVVQAAGTPGEIKNNPNATLVGFTGVVTSNASNIARAIFVEAEDRSSAIRTYQVNTAVNPPIGSLVQVKGTLAETGGERIIGNTEMTVIGSLENPLEPIFACNREIGGESLNAYTPGLTYGNGPYNIALLMTTTGRVTRVDTASRLFFVDDGSLVQNGTDTGVAVSYAVASGTLTPPTEGQYVMVTGLSAVRNYGGMRYPLVRLRSQDDLAFLTP